MILAFNSHVAAVISEIELGRFWPLDTCKYLNSSTVLPGSLLSGVACGYVQRVLTFNLVP